MDIFTYTLLLLDQAGKTYRVIGIGVSTNLLSRSMNYNDLNVNERDGYLLSINNSAKVNDYDIEYINSPYLKSVLPQSNISLNKMENVSNIVSVATERLKESLVVSY